VPLLTGDDRQQGQSLEFNRDHQMNDVAQSPQKEPLRLPGIPDNVQEFLLYILFHMLFPFLPILVQTIVRGYVEEETSLLFLAVYPLSIGVSSQSRLMFGFTVVFCLVYSMLFGLASGSIKLPATGAQIGYGCLAVLMLIHACERYNRHVVRRHRFWEFS
jgi:hypothetical protein